MIVAVMKTKAEQALAQGFEAVAGRLPGGTAVAAVRRRAMSTFEARGLPHRRVEEWKYTDLRVALKEVPPAAVGDAARATAADIDLALAALSGIDACRVVFVNGRHRPELSHGAITGLEVKPLGEALAAAQDKVGEALVASSAPADDAVHALNTAYMTDGAVVRVAAGAAPAKPLLLVFARAGKVAQTVTTRNVVSIADGASVTLIEAHVALAGAAGPGQSNVLTELVAGAGARIAHIKATCETATAIHLATWAVTLGRDAVYRAFQLTAGVGLARNQLFVTCKGEGARLDLSGVFLARGSEHVDTTLVVDHAVPRCESRELFKGVLDDRARGVFQGKVIVRPDAQKTDGKQMAQVLMLSEDAEFDSKPELEIYADDVVCGHGSTSAEIDPELIFYCRSRGMPENVARALLIESFIGEAIEKVEYGAIRDALMAIALAWLEQGRRA